jgi:hypothetical protein
MEKYHLLRSTGTPSRSCRWVPLRVGPTEDAEHIIDELANGIILEHLQPAHETVLAEATELVSATGAEPLNELLNSPRLSFTQSYAVPTTRAVITDISTPALRTPADSNIRCATHLMHPRM